MMTLLVNKWYVLAIVVGLLSVALVACDVTSASAPAEAASSTSAVAAPTGSYEDGAKVDEGGNTSVPAVEQNGPPTETSPETLTDAEVEGLLYMREEEKLARDVYQALYDKWGMRIFQNIAQSEQTHMDAVKTLIDHYGLEDPAAGKDVGVFANPTLQALYDQLIEEGNRSLADALQAGAAIEEIDILDLEERIAQTDKADIQRIYGNLTKGSQNHLRAFVSTLQRREGETYQPQFLSQTAYEAIVDATRGRGQGRRS
jgi:hypothetical protein